MNIEKADAMKEVNLRGGDIVHWISYEKVALQNITIIRGGKVLYAGEEEYRNLIKFLQNAEQELTKEFMTLGARDTKTGDFSTIHTYRVRSFCPENSGD